MAYLMFIGFDNSARLFRNAYYFEYRGIRFKLIQNDCRKWCDVLVTILPNFRDQVAQDKVYSVASEFLSALSWENKSLVTIQNLGGRGCRDSQKLRSAKSQFRAYPRIPFQGYHVGYDISSLPQIENDEQRTALLLYRDALSSNHHYLAFLFFWQILEVCGTNPIQWVDKTIQARPTQLALHDIQALQCGSLSVGNYLNDECRNAIAHIKRRPGSRKLLLDSAADVTRIAISTRAAKALAEFYIKNALGLTKRLHLVRKNGRGFPFYADDKYLRTHGCKIAYNKTLSDVLNKKRWK